MSKRVFISGEVWLRLTVAKESEVGGQVRLQKWEKKSITYSATQRDGNDDQPSPRLSKNNQTHMELGKRVTWARIIPLAHISGSVGVGPELGGTRVASQLGHGSTTGGELKEFIRGGSMVQVTVLIVEIGSSSL